MAIREESLSAAQATLISDAQSDSLRIKILGQGDAVLATLSHQIFKLTGADLSVLGQECDQFRAKIRNCIAMKNQILEPYQVTPSNQLLDELFEILTAGSGSHGSLLAEQGRQLLKSWGQKTAF